MSALLLHSRAIGNGPVSHSQTLERLRLAVLTSLFLQFSLSQQPHPHHLTSCHTSSILRCRTTLSPTFHVTRGGDIITGRASLRTVPRVEGQRSIWAGSIVRLEGHHTNMALTRTRSPTTRDPNKFPTLQLFLLGTRHTRHEA